MALAPTSLRYFATPIEQRGIVTICDHAGEIVREYLITQAEYDAVKAKGGGHPPGCTAAEWRTPGSCITGWPLSPGDALREKEGSLLVQTGEEVVGNRFVRHLVRLTPSDYQVIDGAQVVIDADVLTTHLAMVRA